MYDTILIPTDGSETAEVAVEHAVDHAVKYDAELHALYVVDVDAASYALGTEQVDRIRQGNLDEMTEVKAEADEATDHVAEMAAERDVPVEKHIRVGSPARAIRKFAAENGVDLIVIGSHGRAGLRRVILGSVTEKVLRQTHKPVLVIDSHEEDDVE